MSVKITFEYNVLRKVQFTCEITTLKIISRKSRNLSLDIKKTFDNL